MTPKFKAGDIVYIDSNSRASLFIEAVDQETYRLLEGRFTYDFIETHYYLYTDIFEVENEI